MRLLNTLLLSGLLLSVSNSIAQQEIVIIDKGDFKNYDKKKREIKLNDNTQVFKFAPLNMLVGEINFGYERQIGQKGSLDFELGPTISKVGLGVNSHIVDPLNPPTPSENGGIGFLASAGYRFYPLDETEALNRFYVSPILKYKVLNHSVSDLSGTLSDVNGSNTQFNFLFNFGYQAWVAKKFSMDFYAGLGIGYQKRVDHYITTEFIGTDWQYSWQEEVAKGNRYVFNIGIKLGIGKE